MLLYNVQECLVKVDRNGKIVPWLAERWHTSDNKNYTFFLRKGVRFHNGRELKAADIKFVLQRAMNPETKHPYPGYYEAISDIIVKDDYTVTIALKSLNANFLLNLARAGLGHLSARGGGHAQERAHRHRALPLRGMGARRQDRAGPEQGLLRARACPSSTG